MFDVYWHPRALNQLAQIWQGAGDKEVINDATEGIDRRLERDPFGESESRAGKQRILFQPPLGVRILILPDRNAVYVLTVWHFEKRKK